MVRLPHDVVRAQRRLEPATEIARQAAGGGGRQLIAANVDTPGSVTSCNGDFNLARLERYRAAPMQAGCLPPVILTKADQSAEVPRHLAQAQRLSPLVHALALDARDAKDAGHACCRGPVRGRRWRWSGRPASARRRCRTR